MDPSARQRPAEEGTEHSMPDLPHHQGTAAKSERTRQVAARYLQPKAAAPHSGGQHLAAPGPLTGRASLAAYGSVGWGQTQHPHQAATPMLQSASTGMLRTGSTAQRAARSRSGAPLPTPAPSAVHRQCVPQFATPSTSGRGTQGTLHSLQTPRNLSMSAAISRPSSTANRPGRHSADLTGAVATPLQPADGDMRAKLSAWREMKQQQSARTTAKPGAFKEPAPKSTLFRATAATRANKDPGTGRKAAAGGSGPGKAATAGDRGIATITSSSSSSAAAGAPQSLAHSTVTSPAASSVADSTTAAPASASPASSAFAATMATLQGSGGKTRAASKPSKAGSSRPGIVPMLNLKPAGSGSGGVSTPLHQQQPVSCSPLVPVGSSTKIPKLNLSSLTGQQQQQPQAPLSSRWPSSSGGDAALPDATPRTVRDALPSRVPRTPRTAGTPAAGYQQPSTRRASTPEGSDRHARQLDTCKPATEQQTQQHGSSQQAGGGSSSSSSKPVVPKLKLGAVLGARSPAPGAAAAGMPDHRPAQHTPSCLSARGPSAAGRVTPATARNRTSSDGGAAGSTPASAQQQRGRTPRGLAASSAAAAGRLPTPRSLASSMSSAAAPAAAPAARRPDAADTAEEVRQQLRLLRMQQLQLRHLNARMQTSLQAKKEKINTSVAAAAAAVVDLSNQLLKLKDQAQQASWQSQLRGVLQQQQAQLQAWAQAQEQHQANMAQLRDACSSALSHVPLLNGATVGHNPDQPDLQALQRQLQHGMQLLADLQPAMQLLMTGDVCGSGSAAGMPGIRPGSTSLGSGSRDAQEAGHLHPKGIKDTAALSRDLVLVAEEECGLLQQLTQQLSELSDLQLYVNSMQVQLQFMQQPDLLKAAG